MITTPTLFILGAGASKPYGYPTGKELRRQIIQNFSSDLNSLESHDFSTICDMPKRVIRDIAESFIRKFNLSDTQSVDLFLSRNSEYEIVGKMAIVMEIAKAEKKVSFAKRSRLKKIGTPICLV